MTSHFPSRKSLDVSTFCHLRYCGKTIDHTWSDIMKFLRGRQHLASRVMLGFLVLNGCLWCTWHMWSMSWSLRSIVGRLVGSCLWIRTMHRPLLWHFMTNTYLGSRPRTTQSKVCPDEKWILGFRPDGTSDEWRVGLISLLWIYWSSAGHMVWRSALSHVRW